MRYFIFAFSLLVFLSCNKEKGMLPQEDLNSPYYPDIEAELQWFNQDTNDPLHTINSWVVGDQLIINVVDLEAPKEYLISYEKSSGEKNWEINLEEFVELNPYNAILKLIDDRIFYITKYGKKIVKLNRETGDFIDYYEFDGYEHEVCLFENNVYITENERFSENYDSIKLEVYQFNLETETTKLISDFDNKAYYYDQYQVKPVIDPNQNVLYYELMTRNNPWTFFSNLISVNIEDGETRNIWISSDTLEFVSQPPIAFKDNTLVVPLSNHLIYAINSLNGSIKWKKSLTNSFFLQGDDYVSNQYEHNNEVYMGLNDRELVRYNIENGSIEWKADDNVASNKGWIPSKDLVLQGYEDDKGLYFSLRDLENGQMLFKTHLLDEVESFQNSIYSINYDPTNSHIYVVTSDDISAYKMPSQFE